MAVIASTLVMLATASPADEKSKEEEKENEFKTYCMGIRKLDKDDKKYSLARPCFEDLPDVEGKCPKYGKYLKVKTKVSFRRCPQAML